MKNLILLIAVFTFSIPGNAFTNFNTTTESKPIKTLTEELRPLISISLEFGRRISENDCDNRPGVCKFKININFRNATAQINEFGELVLVIDANKFSKQDVSRYLSGSHFVMGQSLSLDPDVANALGVKKFTLKKGKYKLKKMKNNYLVVFK